MTAAYLLQYDSVHGTWGRDVTGTNSDGSASITIGPDYHIPYLGEKKVRPCVSLDFYYFYVTPLLTVFSRCDFTQPDGVDWKAYNVDIVLECTGTFLSVKDFAPMFAGGVKKVIVAAPSKTAISSVLHL
jgi:glyceraldehyde 3-phosphate dehydrogenase